MFRLLRYFSIASLISMVLAAIALGAFHQTFEKNHLLRFGESRSVAFVQAFSTATGRNSAVSPKLRQGSMQMPCAATRRSPDWAAACVTYCATHPPLP